MASGDQTQVTRLILQVTIIIIFILFYQLRHLRPVFSTFFFPSFLPPLLPSFLRSFLFFLKREVIMHPTCLRTKYIAEGDLELIILLPLPLKCDYRLEQQSSALCSAGDGTQDVSNGCQTL